MAKKQVTQKIKDKVDEAKEVEEQIQETTVIETPQVNPDSNITRQPGENHSAKNDATIQVPEFMDSLLKLYDTYPKLFIDSKGGVYVQPHDDATEYANPYFIQ